MAPQQVRGGAIPDSQFMCEVKEAGPIAPEPAVAQEETA